jgi:hypothetical protein
MTARLKGRRQEVEGLLRRLAVWASGRADVRALALVGSYAYGRPRMGSDVDLVLLTDDVPAYVERTGWTAAFGGARLVRTRRWGAVTERRLRLRSGLHVEVGVTGPGWASVAPVEPGTRRVVTDGLRILHDPGGLLGALAHACGIRTATAG